MINYSCECLDLVCTRPTGGVKYSCEALEVVPGQEGFWRKLVYEFTSDFKCAKRLDEFIKQLNSMDSTKSKELEAVTLDYRAIPKNDISKLLKFATTVVNRSATWIEKCKHEGWLIDGKDGQRRAYLVKETDKLNREFNLDEMENLISGKDKNKNKFPEGKTVRELGFSKADIVKLAQEFKNKASGDLKQIKKIRSISQALIHEYRGNVDTVHLYMYEVTAKLDMAVDAYKRVDYFLYYLSKEV